MHTHTRCYRKCETDRESTRGPATTAQTPHHPARDRFTRETEKHNKENNKVKNDMKVNHNCVAYNGERVTHAKSKERRVQQEHSHGWQHGLHRGQDQTQNQIGRMNNERRPDEGVPKATPARCVCAPSNQHQHRTWLGRLCPAQTMNRRRAPLFFSFSSPQKA